jgi:hypothetical protein
MHARVATFEGGEPNTIRGMVDEIDRQAENGPPEGVPATGILILHNAEGKVHAITLFESEEDLQQGHETLNSMDPPERGGMGKRSSVETFEVGVKRDL